jgi:hypothetical protein
MADLPRGVYEELVTERLEATLRSLDPALVDRGPIDPGDAHEVLARHLGHLAHRALRSAGGDGAAASDDKLMTRATYPQLPPPPATL